VKLDITSESDPLCVVSLRSPQTQNQWVEIGRTERIKNCKHPEWAKSFELDYFFEERQELMFGVYDSDGKSAKMDEHDHIGDVVTSIGQIVGEGAGSFTRDIQLPGREGKKRGVLHVHAEEMSPKATGDVRCHFRGEGLDKKDWFGKSDPFLTLASQSADGTFRKFHQTETIKNNLNPTWRVCLRSFIAGTCTASPKGTLSFGRSRALCCRNSWSLSTFSATVTMTERLRFDALTGIRTARTI
jgi:Ca2+-dependent lipid-binding protein